MRWVDDSAVSVGIAHGRVGLRSRLSNQRAAWKWKRQIRCKLRLRRPHPRTGSPSPAQ